MQMRFGGAAGPIAFERMRRMHNGSWDTITVPMGLALRTSALLEPHAPAGSALVEERFHEFGGNRDARRGDIDGDTADSADELSCQLVTQVVGADLPDLEFNRNDQKFALRKNLLDPPYPTRIWKINLG